MLKCIFKIFICFIPLHILALSHYTNHLFSDWLDGELFCFGAPSVPLAFFFFKVDNPHVVYQNLLLKPCKIANCPFHVCRGAIDIRPYVDPPRDPKMDKTEKLFFVTYVFELIKRHAGKQV